MTIQAEGRKIAGETGAEKQITVGVAGHVDHGKTALVRALTGRDTDRLKEEQKRGMSIVLGFAPLALPGGEVDFIDVPGHEKFIRTMISGATGLDAALLTVAANERVKPQTEEHLTLLELLGVRRGLVALTKSDLVAAPEDRERTVSEVRDFLRETFLRDALLLWTSAVTGEGLEEVRQALNALLHEAEPPPLHPYFYLPIDRAFILTGQGTVVTGTLRRGTLSAGETVQLWPRGVLAEVRGLEVHGQAVAAARPGQRTAVNLRGVKKTDLSRGDALATPGAMRPTRLLDALLTVPVSAGRSLRRGQFARLFHGTGEVSARIYPAEDADIAPGETALAQLRLAEEAVVPAQERFVLRSLSPPETLGGGQVIDPYPQKRTRADADARYRLRILADGLPAEKLSVKLREAGAAGCDLRQTALDLGIADPPAVPGIAIGGLSLHPEVFEALQEQGQAAVRRFHETFPLRRGMPVEEVRRSLPRTLSAAGRQHLLQTLIGAGRLQSVNGLLREPGHSPEAALSPVERAIAWEMEAQFRKAGLRPPGREEAIRKDRRRKKLLQFLSEAEILVALTERASGQTILFHRDTLAAAARTLSAALTGGTGRSVSEINTLLGTSRKFSIPLLEYLDEMGITRREGDFRFWNGKTEGTND